MNWEVVSAAAEVIGVVAVLASILYLARQVSQGNRLNQSDSIRNFLGQYNALSSQVGEQKNSGVWRRGSTDFNTLNPDEQAWLHTILFGHYMLGQAQRMIDPEGNEELSKFADFVIASCISRPGTRVWWDLFKTGLPDQDYVNKIDSYTSDQIVAWEQFMPWFIEINGNDGAI